MIQLNYRDSKPLYEQVQEGLRHLIVSGAMEEGDKLPSVRTLATTLAINPNTIQKAYEKLEQEGYLVAVPGKGSFAAVHGTADKLRRASVLQNFERSSKELLFLGMTVEELCQCIKNTPKQGESI